MFHRLVNSHESAQWVKELRKTSKTKRKKRHIRFAKWPDANSLQAKAEFTQRTYLISCESKTTSLMSRNARCNKTCGQI